MSPAPHDDTGELVTANPRFKRSDDVEMDDDTAVRRLLKQVHVRVLEWMSVAIIDAAAGVVIRVEDMD